MPQERTGVVTFKGKPLTLVGPALKVGDRAPDFTALSKSLEPVTLASLQGKALLLSAVPSLDTGICDLQTKRFNEEARKYPNVQFVTVSVDLPFAQARWCGAAGAEKVLVLSDHRDLSFGLAYGVAVKELRLLARSIFVVDRQGALRHLQIVPEIGSHPNYDAALDVVRALG